jgi:hypothetical protein
MPKHIVRSGKGRNGFIDTKFGGEIVFLGNNNDFPSLFLELLFQHTALPSARKNYSTRALSGAGRLPSRSFIPPGSRDMQFALGLTS